MADDYQLLMSILAKNMTEGADEAPAAPPHVPKKTETGESMKTVFLLLFYKIIECFCRTINAIHSLLIVTVNLKLLPFFLFKLLI